MLTGWQEPLRLDRRGVWTVSSDFQGFWWRPRNAQVHEDVEQLLGLKVTDVLVWAEPFVDRVDEWSELLHRVQASGIRFHTWITANHHYAQSFVQRLRNHSDWVAVDYQGFSSDVRPLAGVQTWACPANEERWLKEWEIWMPLVQGTNGLHLDYIRYPDGFRFGDKPEIDRVEVLEQSFCYCAQCCQRFQADYGINPRTIPVEDGNSDFAHWQHWRQERIVDQVAWYREQLRKEKDPSMRLSAAVFPTPAIARKNVQQNWPKFAQFLDFVCPMIYAKQFWGQPVSWTEDAVRQGKAELATGTKLLAGIGPHESYRPDELAEAIWSGRAGGSDGEMLFLFPMPPSYLAALKTVWV